MAAGPLVFWLVLMGAPLSEIVNGRMRPAWLAIAGLAVFCVLYAGTVLAASRARIGPAVRYALLATLAVVSAWYTLRFGQTAGEALPLLAMAAGSALPLVWPAGVGVAVVTLLSVLIEVRMGDPTSVGGVAFGTSTAGTVIVVLRRLFATIAELRATREELAHAAVSRERRRFARDLHDLLGHTLSVIVVKGEIVRRLAGRDPEAAAAQAGDIVEIGRAALGEVREAVSGYRTRGLTAEMDDARAALDDAGVEAVVTRAGPPPPAETDLLLGWVVRESVTNVIRHAGARQCRIAVSGDDAVATVTIADDGHGAPGPAYGNGLTGMRERVTAAGGELHTGPGRRGGFTVTASVPVDAAGPENPGPAGSASTTVRNRSTAESTPRASTTSPETAVPEPATEPGGEIGPGPYAEAGTGTAADAGRRPSAELGSGTRGEAGTEREGEAGTGPDGELGAGWGGEAGTESSTVRDRDADDETGKGLGGPAGAGIEAAVRSARNGPMATGTPAGSGGDAGTREGAGFGDGMGKGAGG